MQNTYLIVIYFILFLLYLDIRSNISILNKKVFDMNMLISDFEAQLVQYKLNR